MNPTDLRLFCTALAFTAVVTQDGLWPDKEAARRAGDLARPIERFCRETLPEQCSGNDREQGADASPGLSAAEHMAAAISAIYREKGGCLPQDLIGRGYPRDEIDRHWAMAKALAQVELNIKDS